MNKAFVREAESSDGYCPRCGALGTAASSAAMDTHIAPRSRRSMGETAWFCGFARCDVAYFNALETVVRVTELVKPVYPKDPGAPICPCFGFTVDEIRADIRDGTPVRIRELLAKSQSPQAHCNRSAPDGKCCMREVQRLFIKMREEE